MPAIRHAIFILTFLLLLALDAADAGAYVRWSVRFIAKGVADEARVVGEIEKRLGDVKLEF